MNIHKKEIPEINELLAGKMHHLSALALQYVGNSCNTSNSMLPLCLLEFSEGEISELNGYLFPKHFMTAGKPQADRILAMKGSEKGVIVVGLAKTGNHFFMSLLDALGCDRAEELGVKGGISSIPFEAQADFLIHSNM